MEWTTVLIGCGHSATIRYFIGIFVAERDWTSCLFRGIFFQPIANCCLLNLRRHLLYYWRKRLSASIWRFYLRITVRSLCFSTGKLNTIGWIVGNTGDLWLCTFGCPTSILGSHFCLLPSSIRHILPHWILRRTPIESSSSTKFNVLLNLNIRLPTYVYIARKRDS